MAEKDTRPVKVTIQPKRDPKQVMKCSEWHGKHDVRLGMKHRPTITDPTDVILKVTSTCICGSDLHLYVGAMPGMQPGDTMGHEFMGIIDEVGADVKTWKKGERAVACFDIGCGVCFFCKRQLYSLCDSTNLSKEEAKLYGDRTGGFYGYSHLTGGWEGGQAEYVRVPIADFNLLHIPQDIPDKRVVLLSDILPTAWNACEMGEVGKGDIVAIWGCGPVGQLTAHCAHVRGASRIIVIDNIDYRMQHLKRKIPMVELLNYEDRDVVQTLKEWTDHGPDVVIEAAGFHYAKTLRSATEMALGLATDPCNIVNEMILSVRKGGHVSIVGVYAGYCNHYNIGAMMEKGLTVRGSQTPVQKYWGHLLQMVEEGKLDPTFVITHQPPLTELPNMYKIFNNKEDGCIKVVMHPFPDLVKK